MAELFKSAVVAGTTVMLSVVNWGEVYYTLVNRIGIARAEGVIAETLRSAPIALISVTPDDAIRAARLKAQYKVPYADSCAAALAGNQNVLVTANVERFERRAKLRLLKLPRATRT